ncbi:unnamed protein product [Polarella glacialis]|uniref:Uncharacterized protein n=1 Tax=Polarella glacialis TaxID=89957 RepID=A0A813K807_POLGL|nr:unnamed protein product [Polarella glacialis]
MKDIQSKDSSSNNSNNNSNNDNKDSSHASDLDAAVCSLADCRRLATFRFSISAVSPFLALRLDQRLVLNDWTYEELIGGHVLTAALVIAVAALCVIWKRQPISALRACFILLVLGRISWKLFQYKNAYQLVFDRTDVMSIRFGCSFIAGSPGVTAVLNCIYSALSLATDRRLVSEASSTMQVKASHAEHQSLSMLLNTMHDVVVELDSLFGLVDKGERLSAFLLQGGRSLRNTCILDLMYQEADRESFSQHLTQPRHGPLQDMAIPIHARLRDSSGLALHVELIHAQYERLDGSVHYIVGIRELEREEPEILETGLRPAPRVIGALESRDLKGGTPGLHDRNDIPRLSRTRRSSETKLLLPNFSETPVQTRLVSILSLMSRWNVQVSSKTCRCCTFHAVAKEVVFATNLLKNKKCLNMADSLLATIGSAHVVG